MNERKQSLRNEIIRLALPMALQQFMTALVGACDAIMLGKLSQNAMSAVSLATQVTFVFNLFMYAFVTGENMFVAQYYGKGDYKGISKIFSLVTKACGVVAVIFLIGTFFFPRQIMAVLTNEEELITLGSEYLRVIGISYLLSSIAQTFLAIMKNCNAVNVSTLINSVMVILNIILNAVFIFGLFGAPRLGAAGVAIATASSRLVELVACVIVSFMSKNVKLNLTYMFIRSKVLFHDFMKLSLPALGNDVSWSVAFSMYSVILGHLGTDAVAANSLVTVVRNIGSVFCFAIASAGTILLGNVMGKGDLEKSKVYASRMLKMTVIAGAIGGVIVFAITPLVMRFASLSDGAMHYLKYMLLINTYYIMGSAVNTALIAGVFRAGGDTKFGLICDTIDMWVYAVPLGFFAAFVLKLPVLWVYFLLCTDEFVKWPWVFHHYRQGKWAQNITREDLFEQEIAIE